MPQDRELIIPRGGELHRFVLETFAATGRSPALDEMRAHLRLSSAGEVEALLLALERRGAIHRTPGDRAITHAYPFSNEPTAHRVRLVGGPEVYAMCAIDALGMPFMLRTDADITSACAGCGAEVRVRIQSERITDHAPVGLVVWYASVAEGCCPATDLCPDLNFFCSPACLEAWAAGPPAKDGGRLDLPEALARGRQVFEGLLYRGGDCCAS